MQDAGKTYGISPQTTPFFKRNDPIPDIGSEPGISREAFQLTKDKKLADRVIKGQKGYYLIELKERQPPDIDGFAAQKDAIIQRLKNQKSLKRYNLFLTQLKSESEIEVAPEFSK